MKLNSWGLRIRLWLAMVLLFGLVYVILLVAGTLLDFGGYEFYAALGLGVVLLQYLIGPIIVQSSMNVEYVSETEEPELHRIISDLAMSAGIPKPKVGISNINIPNAFAFGRTKKDGRVCVTKGLLNKLNKEELKAVLAHEIAHIKHSDMAVTTLVSAVPLICYFIAISFFYGGNSRNSGGFIIGILAFGAYLLGQLIVLFVSRTREYYADQGSIELGGRPEKLASALYKLVYDSATANKEEVKNIQGIKAFCLNDVSVAANEINELSQLDIDHDGEISASELSQLKYKKVNIKTSDKLMELISTHPNMLKRIERLAEYS
ncbi:MAG: M48 family metalloprotease [Methanobacteriaceae archaeon]|jgi:heat shock protein HtpX|nr:M48 family metalloprotease [Candidatus Methanorudis spinitermitis]